MTKTSKPTATKKTATKKPIAKKTAAKKEKAVVIDKHSAGFSFWKSVETRTKENSK